MSAFLKNEFTNLGAALMLEAANGVYKGLMGIGIQIVDESIPRTPVDTGHLRNSVSVLSVAKVGRRYKTIRKKRDARYQKQAWGSLKGFVGSFPELTVLVSFTASYAIYVHELHKTNAKFFEMGINKVRPNAHILMAQYYKMPWAQIKIAPSTEAFLAEGSRLDRP